MRSRQVGHLFPKHEGNCDHRWWLGFGRMKWLGCLIKPYILKPSMRKRHKNACSDISRWSISLNEAFYICFFYPLKCWHSSIARSRQCSKFWWVNLWGRVVAFAFHSLTRTVENQNSCYCFLFYNDSHRHLQMAMPYYAFAGWICHSDGFPHFNGRNFESCLRLFPILGFEARRIGHFSF